MAVSITIKNVTHILTVGMTLSIMAVSITIKNVTHTS